jgi:hypothetical protein
MTLVLGAWCLVLSLGIKKPAPEGKADNDVRRWAGKKKLLPDKPAGVSQISLIQSAMH